MRHHPAPLRFTEASAHPLLIAGIMTNHRRLRFPARASLSFAWCALLAGLFGCELAETEVVGEDGGDELGEIPANFSASLGGGAFRIQAEDYGDGGADVAYHDTTPGNTGGVYRDDDVDIQATGDTGGGYNVGWIREGEFLAYHFDLPAPADVNFEARISSAIAGNKTVRITVDGARQPEVVYSGQDGWQVYSDLGLGTVALDAGRHRVRIDTTTGDFNLNYIRVTYAPVCTVTSKLVNTCRPWLGAWSMHSQDAPGGDAKSQLLWHEQRIGRKVDIVHSYHPPGSKPLDSYEKYFLDRPDTILLINWKPTETWREADGRNSTVNANIDATATALKAIAPKKVMLALFHEPEDNVSGGVSCVNPPGGSGTPAEYRAMWQNVRDRFDAKGVNNVVWVWNVMGYSGWFCMLKDLYPGDDLVDWIMWDPYIRGANDNFDLSISSFYDWMEEHSDATHQFTKKAWGLAEWGTWDSTQPQAYKAFDDAKLAVENNWFPRLKALVIFDARTGSRIAYSHAGAYDAEEVKHYRAFAQSAAFRDP